MKFVLYGKVKDKFEEICPPLLLLKPTYILAHNAESQKRPEKGSIFKEDDRALPSIGIVHSVPGLVWKLTPAQSAFMSPYSMNCIVHNENLQYCKVNPKTITMLFCVKVSCCDPD